MSLQIVQLDNQIVPKKLDKNLFKLKLKSVLKRTLSNYKEESLKMGPKCWLGDLNLRSHE